MILIVSVGARACPAQKSDRVDYKIHKGGASPRPYGYTDGIIFQKLVEHSVANIFGKRNEQAVIAIVDMWITSLHFDTMARATTLVFLDQARFSLAYPQETTSYPHLSTTLSTNISTRNRLTKVLETRGRRDFSRLSITHSCRIDQVEDDYATTITENNNGRAGQRTV